MGNKEKWGRKVHIYMIYRKGKMKLLMRHMYCRYGGMDNENNSGNQKFIHYQKARKRFLAIKGFLITTIIYHSTPR